MSIQIDSYRENWQKDGKDLIFYRRRYIKTFIIILIALFVIFFCCTIYKNIPTIWLYHYFNDNLFTITLD